MTILFKELAGSPTETYGPEGVQAERRLLCAYEDRLAVVTSLLGAGGAFGGQSPAQYPGWPWVFAARVRVEPFEKSPDDQGAFADLTADMNNYSNQFAQIIVNYELLDPGRPPKLPKAKAGTILTYRMNLGGEYIRLPGQSFHWEADPTCPVPPDVLPTLRIPVVEHQVTWQRVLDPPWDAVRSCTGAVNDSPFLGADPETVLFDGAKADREFTGLGDFLEPQFGWRLTYIFREKLIKVAEGLYGTQTYGWNHTYRDVPYPYSCWDRLVDPDGCPLYKTEDFSALFEFATT